MSVYENPRGKTDWASLVVAGLMFVWLVGVSVFIQFGAALVAAQPSEFGLPSSVKMPQVFVSAALLQTVALLLPLIPLALLWRAPRYRGAFRTWLAATFFLLLLTPARLFPSPDPQETLLLQSFLALVFSAVLWFMTGRGKILERASSAAIALAAALALLLALPWLLWGALGSVGDIVLGIVSALTFALAGTLITTRVWLRRMAQDSHGAGWDITLGGFVLGGMLLVMGAAAGFIGTQLFFIFLLGVCGWLLMDLVQVNFRATTGWNDVALFVFLTLAVAAPLLLLDPDTGVILASIGDGEALSYATDAVELAVLGALVFGLLLFLLRKQIAEWQRPSLLWVGAALVALVAGVVYFVFGQPGLYGDRVFVILQDQADVSAAKNIANYDDRRAFVYTTLTQHANQTQAGLRAALDQFRIGYTPYYLVNGLEVSADLPVQWWLAGRPEVDRILPSPRLRPLHRPPPPSTGDSTTPPTAPDWNLTLIGADRVWKELGVRGAGIVVGQSDTGVDSTHPEIAAQYRGHDGTNDYNWLDPWNHSTAPQDVGGHGTHTMGSILGKNVGVAPDAQWIGCVNLARNLGDPPLYLSCLQFDFAPYPLNGDALRDGAPARGAMVLNNSWGCPDVEGCDPNALLPAVNALRDAGVFVVASAGNDGPACSSVADPISLYDNVFSVGAVDRNKQLAGFSSRGPVTSDGSGRVKPDISAPGVNVLSSLPGGTYGTESGTSMAGPHIVGVVALLWSANPKLIGDIDTTEQIMRETAQPANVTPKQIVCGDPNATPNDLVGYGIVDAYAAVKRALAEK